MNKFIKLGSVTSAGTFSGRDFNANGAQFVPGANKPIIKPTPPAAPKPVTTLQPNTKQTKNTVSKQTTQQNTQQNTQNQFQPLSQLQSFDPRTSLGFATWASFLQPLTKLISSFGGLPALMNIYGAISNSSDWQTAMTPNASIGSNLLKMPSIRESPYSPYHNMYDKAPQQSTNIKTASRNFLDKLKMEALNAPKQPKLTTTYLDILKSELSRTNKPNYLYKTQLDRLRDELRDINRRYSIPKTFAIKRVKQPTVNVKEPIGQTEFPTNPYEQMNRFKIPIDLTADIAASTLPYRFAKGEPAIRYFARGAGFDPAKNLVPKHFIPRTFARLGGLPLLGAESIVNAGFDALDLSGTYTPYVHSPEYIWTKLKKDTRTGQVLLNSDGTPQWEFGFNPNAFKPFEKVKEFEREATPAGIMDYPGAALHSFIHPLYGAISLAKFQNETNPITTAIHNPNELSNWYKVMSGKRVTDLSNSSIPLVQANSMVNPDWKPGLNNREAIDKNVEYFKKTDQYHPTYNPTGKNQSYYVPKIYRVFDNPAEQASLFWESLKNRGVIPTITDVWY